MDENFNIPSASYESSRHVSDSPESKPEICEQTECLATSSTSVNENIPIMSRESMVNIQSKGVVKRELRLSFTTDSILADAIKSINSFIQPLTEEQKKCNDLVQINNLNIPTSSAEELVDKLKLLTGSGKLLNAERNINFFLSEIEMALNSIKANLHLPLADGALHEAFVSLYKCIQDIGPKQAKHRIVLTQVKESLVKRLPFPSSVDKEVSNEFHSLMNYLEWIIAELNPQVTVFENIVVSLRSTNENISKEI